ncbi:MAG: hypothetical protein ACOCTL_04965, partial [Candidatus Hadarchaeota archaeon]
LSRRAWLEGYSSGLPSSSLQPFQDWSNLVKGAPGKKHASLQYHPQPLDRRARLKTAKGQQN